MVRFSSLARNSVTRCFGWREIRKTRNEIEQFADGNEKNVDLGQEENFVKTREANELNEVIWLEAGLNNSKVERKFTCKLAIISTKALKRFLNIKALITVFAEKLRLEESQMIPPSNDQLRN